MSYDILSIRVLRLERQHLTNPANKKAYESLFRDLSPVATPYWTMPGEPPVLKQRTTFNDFYENDFLRSRRIIIKGRFQNQTIGYVRLDELPLYAALYRVPLKTVGHDMNLLMELLEHEGPMTIKTMREILEMRAKDITPMLHALQSAFLVYEDQRDSEWDRNWFVFEREFPEINLEMYTFDDALKIVLMRFQKRMVTFESWQAASFYKLPLKAIENAIAQLVDSGDLVRTDLGLVSPGDQDYLTNTLLLGNPSVFCLNRNDFLVRSSELMLKKRYVRSDSDPIYYLYVDGDFGGCVFGKFKNGPFLLEDVVLDMDPDVALKRKTAIIDSIHLAGDNLPLLRFNGELIRKSETVEQESS